MIELRIEIEPTDAPTDVEPYGDTTAAASTSVTYCETTADARATADAMATHYGHTYLGLSTADTDTTPDHDGGAILDGDTVVGRWSIIGAPDRLGARLGGLPMASPTPVDLPADTADA